MPDLGLENLGTETAASKEGTVAPETEKHHKELEKTENLGASQTGAVHGVTFGAEGPVLDVGNGTKLPIASVLTIGDGTSPASTPASSTPAA